MPRSCARRTTSVISSGLITAPEGFDGEFRIMSLVFGVIRRATISRGHAEILRLIGLDEDAVAAGVAHHVLERDPVGHWQNHFIAVIDQDGDHVEERVFAAD